MQYLSIIRHKQHRLAQLKNFNYDDSSAEPEQTKNSRLKTATQEIFFLLIQLCRKRCYLKFDRKHLEAGTSSHRWFNGDKQADLGVANHSNLFHDVMICCEPIRELGDTQTSTASLLTQHFRQLLLLRPPQGDCRGLSCGKAEVRGLIGNEVSRANWSKGR